MPSQMDVEKDPFLVLLTDALRAGPGSPEWRDAVTKLKVGGGEADEYRLLIEAREALESGREYRSVRAGPGFTRKLLNNLEAGEPAAKRALPLAGLIAGLAVLVIAAVVGIAIHEVYRSGAVNPAPRGNVEELAGTYLPNTLLASNFESSIPPGWRKIGSLPLNAEKGLASGKGAVATDGGYVGGGVVISDAIPADQTFSVSAVLQIRGTGDGLIPQVFVAASPDFSADRAISAQEIVWELEGTDQKVIIDGRVEKQAALPAHARTLSVRLIVNKDLAVVETAENQRLWAGSHALGNTPRYVGVRFLRTAGKAEADISVQSVRIQKN
jgi:hypothetical protein